MKKYEEIKFDKIIFCGSILNSKLDFRDLIEKKQFNKINNDHGSLEWFLKYTRGLIDNDCGKAGKVGFLDIPPSHINSILNSGGYKSHSDYFLPIHMEQKWVPFLLQDLIKFNYKEEILKKSITDRLYQNTDKDADNFHINEIKFFARVDNSGNYYAKYEKNGVNESEQNIIDSLTFYTSADGMHDAQKMGFVAYDRNNTKLNCRIESDYNNRKIFIINLLKSYGFKENIYLKVYFCWLNTINLKKGDTDHWYIKNIPNVFVSLNFPNELINPRLFIIKNEKIIGQRKLLKKTEEDKTVSYSLEFKNSNNDDGLIFYFEGQNTETNLTNRRSKDVEFIVKGRKDQYIITKASEADIQKIYAIETEIELSNAASEETLKRRREMFKDGFLVVKYKRDNKVVGYLESMIWNEKPFHRFEEISNFPLHFNVNGNILYVIFVAVQKKFRSKGIGGRLLNEIEVVARDF